ncbi:macrophage infectivity potentiator Mip [Nibrella viscosa]|uniref:Peptidyl-prolyl cis-trans isomerase n=1 Tax=Nibrella viscosa TaxID=1084524 RepID=A0ABP8K390_9BACT
MTLNQWVKAGLLSAAFVSGSAFLQETLAQAKKPAAGAPAKKPATAAQKATPATASSRIATSRDSLSYSIGVSIAQNIKQQGIEDLNTDVLARGLQDALKGQKLAMSEEQSQQILMAYMQKQYAAKMEESKKAGEANKKVGDAFLAENKSKPGVITTASGLQYQVVKEGTGPKPTTNDKVKAHYTGRLINGTVFDSSVERGQPIEIPVTGVIPGWVEALQLMPVGSKWTLFIPGSLAYGERGAGGAIGPNETLIFDIELLEIVK